MEIKARARKWGNSLAVILPRAIVREQRIHEDDEIVIQIAKRPLAREVFGRFPPTDHLTAQELKDRARGGW